MWLLLLALLFSVNSASSFALTREFSLASFFVIYLAPFVSGISLRLENNNVPTVTQENSNYRDRKKGRWKTGFDEDDEYFDVAGSRSDFAESIILQNGYYWLTVPIPKFVKMETISLTVEG